MDPSKSLKGAALTIEKRQREEGRSSREEKRRKWEAKQAKKQEQQQVKTNRVQWIEQNSTFASWVADDDADAFRKENTTNNAVLDRLLLPYKDLQDIKKKAQIEDSTDSEQRLFIAEGTETIRLLIQQTYQARSNRLAPIQVRSIFVKPSILFEQPVHLILDIQKAQEKHRNSREPGFHVLVGHESTLGKVAGFQISRGAMACGVVPKDCDEAWLDDLLSRRFSDTSSKKLRLLALDGICDTANMGSMIRCAAAFGVDAIILSRDCCDAWYRRSIRVSMGHIFNVGIARVDDLASLLKKWKVRFPQLVSFAAVIDTHLLLNDRQHVDSGWCCVMGNEGNGISPAVADACSERIRIDIEKGVDSLSVPVACGILLHGLREREK